MDQNSVLFQDNTSIHKSVSTLDWLSVNNIKTSDIPAKNPNVNPIENLWGTLVHQVYANGKQFNLIVELKAANLESWN